MSSSSTRALDETQARREAAADQTAPSTDKNATAADQAPAADQKADAGQKLPQTASPLPLLGLLGFGSLAAGFLGRKKK